MTEPDYRFTLANERTFLAYLRTGLALDAGGLALAHHEPVLGCAIAACGLLASVAGYLRWRANERAIRADGPLPATGVPLALVVATSVAVIAAAVLLLR